MIKSNREAEIKKRGLGLIDKVLSTAQDNEDVSRDALGLCFLIDLFIDAERLDLAEIAIEELEEFCEVLEAS